MRRPDQVEEFLLLGHNPSYLPPQLATYFVRFGAPWPALRDSNLRLLLETAPKGFTPDWVRMRKGKAGS